MGLSTENSGYLSGSTTSTWADLIKENAFRGSRFRVPLGNELTLQLGVAWTPHSPSDPA